MSLPAKYLKRNQDKSKLNDITYSDETGEKVEVLKVSFNGNVAVEVNKAASKINVLSSNHQS